MTFYTHSRHSQPVIVTNRKDKQAFSVDAVVQKLRESVRLIDGGHLSVEQIQREKVRRDGLRAMLAPTKPL
jgi:hypothetical protein